MSQFAQSPTISASSERSSSESPLLTVRVLLAIAGFAERHAWVAFAAVSVACGWGHVRTLIWRPLDYDELFTFYIAQAPTLRRLLELTRTIDFHPPLSYLLVRVSFAIFGVSSWSCRLPSLLSFLFASVLLFWLVKRILSPLFGLIAVLILWSIQLSYLATEARAYSLLLCFTALMLASWWWAVDGQHERSRRWALASLAAGGLGLLLSHVLGVLSYAAFFAAECLRLRVRRKADWPLWGALMAPLPAMLTHLPLIHSHTTLMFAREYRITPLRMFSFYWESIRFVATPLVVMAVLALLWPFMRQSTFVGAPTARPSCRVPFRPLLALFSVIPLAVGILFSYTGAYFFDRYGIVWLIPLTLVPVLVFGDRTRCDRVAGAVVALLLATLLFFNTAGRSWLVEQVSSLAPPKVVAKLLYVVAMVPIYPPHNYPPVPPYLSAGVAQAATVDRLDTFMPDLPLVAHTALTFLELDHQEAPEVTRRLYLLTDEEAASAIAHDTVFAHFERVKEVFPIPGKVEPYCSFVSTHPRFLVVGAYDHPTGWLLRKLYRDGAELRVAGVCRANTTEVCQIYEVNIGNAKCQPTISADTIVEESARGLPKP